MKRAALLAISLCVGAGLGWGQASEKKPEAAKPIAPLSWLVGGTWTADASKMGPGMKQIETRYKWSDNGAYIQFNTHFVFDKGTSRAYDGHFFWNPDQKSLAMWYMDAKNGITQGAVEVNGDVTKIAFHGPDFEGNIADLQVTVTRKTNDEYHWALSEKDGANWKELASLEYLRVSGS